MGQAFLGLQKRKKINIVGKTEIKESISLQIPEMIYVMEKRNGARLMMQWSG